MKTPWNQRTKFLLGTFLILGCPGFLSAQQTGTSEVKVPRPPGEPSAEVGFAEVWQRVEQLFETYDQNALQPVVRQQFVLAAARSFYLTTGQTPPANLRHQVASLADTGEFRQWLANEWKRTRPDQQVTDREFPALDRISHSILRQVSPAARYVSATENRVARQLADNQYVGIGIQVKWESDKAMIVDPFRGGAAFLAGAVPNDYILSVDGQSMKGKNLKQVIDVLRGPEGSEVSVILQNQDGSQPRTLNMVRTVIPIPSVQGVRQNDDGSWEFMSENGSPFAYMKINAVSGSTSAELTAAARQVVGQGAQGVLLDLRGLRSGNLHQLNLVADALVGAGDFGMLTTVSGSSRMLTTRPDSDFHGLPMAVLTTEERVTGPVFALLAMLKQRPETAIVGTPVSSELRCFDSFELADGAGAIDHLAWAVIKPQGEPGLLDTRTQTRLSGQSMAQTDRYFLQPSVHQTVPEKMLEEVRSFLKRQAGLKS